MAGNVWADREEDRSAFPIGIVGTERSFFCLTSRSLPYPARTQHAGYRLRPPARGNHHAGGPRVAGVPAAPWSWRSMVRLLPLAGLSAESTTLLLRERAHGPVLLPSLSPSRPSARTLGSGHGSPTTSRGHRPVCHVGARHALDPLLVIDGRHLDRKQRNYAPTHPNVGQRRGHRYSCLASHDHLSLSNRAQKPRNYRAHAHMSS